MDKPLALKLAPKSLNEVYGQSHLIGENKIISNIFPKPIDKSPLM